MAGLWQGPLCYRLLLEYGRAHDCRAWMSNWQYANILPTKQYRSANSLPRELSLYTKDGEIYMAADAVKRKRRLRKDEHEVGSLVVNGGEPVGGIGSQHRWSV
mgnify:CR=1 FL=1